MKDKKLKVLHFPIRNSNGGVTRSALKYWKYIDQDRFQFDFATCSPRLDFEQDITEQGCKVHYISCYAEEDAERFYRELCVILRQGYDVVHLHTSWWKSFYAESAAREAGTKTVVVHAHSTFVDIPDERQRQQELAVHEKLKMDFTSDLATHLLACSAAAADFLFGPQIPRKAIRLLHNAVDIDRFRYEEQKRAAIRNALHLQGRFVIGNIGRMCYAKNQMFLLDCFYEVQKMNENAVLLLIGEGELEKDIFEKIEQYGMQGKVLLTGAVENAEDYLQAMDVFTLPSRFEGLPCVLIEAQAAGLPCISSVHVTEEAKITDKVTFVELEKEKWVRTILQYAKGYERTNADEQIRAAGYDIREEIKTLEEIYCAACER